METSSTRNARKKTAHSHDKTRPISSPEPHGLCPDFGARVCTFGASFLQMQIGFRVTFRALRENTVNPVGGLIIPCESSLYITMASNGR